MFSFSTLASLPADSDDEENSNKKKNKGKKNNKPSKHDDDHDDDQQGKIRFHRFELKKSFLVFFSTLASLPADSDDEDKKNKKKNKGKQGQNKHKDEETETVQNDTKSDRKKPKGGKKAVTSDNEDEPEADDIPPPIVQNEVQQGQLSISQYSLYLSLINFSCYRLFRRI